VRLPFKFHHPVLTRSEVNMLTNTHTHTEKDKQRDAAKTSNVLRYTTTLDNHCEQY